MEKQFNSLYKELYQKLYTLAFRVTGCPDIAEDVLQNSFLNAYRSLANFRGESSLSTWIYRIVINTAKKASAQSRKLPVIQYAEANQISEDRVYQHINSYGKVEDKALASLARESCLQMFMNCMPGKYRAVYTLRVILHFSVTESAQILEWSESAVKVNLHRARAVVQNHMVGRCSLIKAGAACDCRSYAKFLQVSGKCDKLLNVEMIRNKEQIAQKEFQHEINQIWEIEALYDSEIKPVDYDYFMQQVKKLRGKKKLKILGV